MNFYVTIPNRTERENQLWLLNKCLESLFQCEPSLSGKVIVVDDHSPVDVLPILNKYPVKMLRHRERVSYSKMINSSIKVARSQAADGIITINNDIEHQVPFLDKLVSLYKKDKALSVVGAWLLFPDGSTQHSGVEVVEGNGPWAIDEYRQKFDRSLSRYCHHVTGAWQSIKISDDMILYDERFPFGFEDVDYCMRTWEAGKRVYLDTRIFHIHHESATRGKGTSPREVESMKRFRSSEYQFKLVNDQIDSATSERLLENNCLQLLPK